MHLSQIPGKIMEEKPNCMDLSVCETTGHLNRSLYPGSFVLIPLAEHDAESYVNIIVIKS